MRFWIGAAFVIASSLAAGWRGQPASAQIIPKGPSDFPSAAPTGDAGCSVEKSCAELAPEMIRSAMGDSPLEANVRSLSKLRMRRQAVAWTVEALKQIGVDSVKTEAFDLPGRRGQRRVSGTNVVGEIRGWEKPDEFVVLAAKMARPDSHGTPLDS